MDWDAIWKSMKAAMMRAWRFLAPTRPARFWLTTALPITIALAFLLSIGPSLQQVSASVIRNDTPDLYSAAYKDSIASFPRLLTWLSIGVDWFYLTFAGLVILLSIRARRTGFFLILIAAWVAALWSLSDLIFGPRDGFAQLNNIIFNGLGGLLIALVIATTLALRRQIIALFGAPSRAAVILSALLIALSGPVVSTLGLFTMREFFEPQKVKLGLIIGEPGDGVLRTSAPAKPGVQAVNLLPVKPLVKDARIISSEMATRVDWSQTSQDRSYDLEVRALGDCAYEHADKLTRTKPFLTLKNVHRISLDMGQGFNFVDLASPEKATYTIQGDTPLLFWAQKPNPKTLAVQYFVGKPNRIVVTHSGDFSLVEGVVLVKERDKRTFGAERRIDLLIDGVPHRISFSPAKMNLKKLICHPITLRPDARGRNWRAPDGIGYGSLLLNLKARSYAAYFEPTDARVTVQGLEGSLELNGISIADLDSETVGPFDMVVAGGALSDASIDQANLTLKPYSRLAALGPLSGSFMADGRLRVLGVSRAVWRDNNERLAPTRWERFPKDWKTPVLGAVLTGLGGFIVWLLAQARLIWNEPFES